ncbi:MAG TPA: trimethylamine methyltransferase family protein [Candidatus Lokiarchaeia archaeon]|nr:trimethylamine methyltransferase family protein [Candidatus Lokiarchaeia archaeon]
MREGEKVKFPGLNRMWRIGTKDELEMLDNAACKILSEMGVCIDDKDCIEYLKDAPVEIDEKELIVKFPEDWVREMLAKAPKSYVLAGRDPAKDLSVTSAQRDFYTLTCSGATKMFEWNDSTSQWDSRDPGEEDVIRAFKMVDAIDAYEGFYGTMVEDVARTKQGLPAELHTAYNKMKYSTKHGGPCAITENGAKAWDYLGRLAAEVQGGLDELQARPIIAGLPTCIGPLTSTRQNFWSAVGAAKYHLPTYPYWGGTTPFTAPATAPAAAALALACTHYCVAVSQYLDPGTAAIPWPFVTPTDPQTGQLAMTPLSTLVAGLATQVYQDLYDLPTSSCSYCLTSPLDEASATWMASLLAQMLWGGNIVQVGTTPQAFMWETIPMGESILNYLKQMLFEMSENLLNFDEEHLAMDVIKQVGPKGMFTTNPHTLKWIDPKLGLFWHSNDWIHEHADQWRNKGGKTWTQVCRERLVELEKHEPDPLANDVDERMQDILKEADESLALF